MKWKFFERMPCYQCKQNDKTAIKPDHKNTKINGGKVWVFQIKCWECHMKLNQQNKIIVFFVYHYQQYLLCINLAWYPDSK